MKLKLILIFSLFISGFSFSQVTIDNVHFEESSVFCYGNYKILVIEATDIGGGSLFIDDILFDNDYLYTDANPFDIVISGNTYTFYVYIEYNYSNAPADNTIALDNMTINVINSGVDFDIYTFNDIEIYGDIIPEFSVSSLNLCSNGLTIDISEYIITPGGTFYWWGINNSEEFVSNSNVFSPKSAFEYYEEYGEGDYGIEYNIVNSVGCYGYSYLMISFDEAPEINLSPIIASTCGNANGSVTANITGDGPFKVYWSTGKNETDIPSTSMITNVSSGVYYINVTDDNGCKNVKKANVSDADISVTESITSQYCQGQNGNVNLAITPSTGSVSSIFWSNGATTNNLFAPAGEYSIQVHTTNNCNFFGTYIIPDSSLKIKLNDAYSNYYCSSTPDGAIYINTMGGQGTYTWDWRRNESATPLYPGLDVESLVDVEGGVYKCTVSDGAGCSLTWSQTIGNYNDVYLWINEITVPNCGNNNGSIDIEVDDFWGETPTTYQWNTGSSLEDLINVSAGTYTLTYSDAAGCESYLTVELNNELPYQPQICLLSVDTSLTYNQVIWQKDPTQSIAGFNVYRETSSYAVFEKVAQRPYSLESVYVDNAASPVDRSWRYYITTYDACGGESYGSFIHKTIHITVESISGGTYNLSWDDYEGINYSSVELHRFDNVNGWVNIATLSAGTNSHPDTPTEIDGLDYMVSFVLADACVSTKAQDHNASRSNKTSAVFNPGGQTDVSIIEHEEGEIKMYPNPTNQDLNIYIENYDNFEYIRILNMNGQVIFEQNITNNFTTIDFSEFANHIYFVQIVAQNNVVTQKIIKN